MITSVPNMHSIVMLAFTCLSLFLYTRQKYSMEAISLFIVIALMLFFFLFPYEIGPTTIDPINFLSGFGHEALITICALLILGKGLEVTGALRPVGIKLSKVWLKHPKSASLMTIVTCAVLSAFLNNTPIIVMLLPLLIGIAVRIKLVPSSILMPIGFAAIVGGMATTIGTSTNLLVLSVAEDLGVRKFNMFDFAFPVAIVGIFAILYLWLLAPKLIPKRDPPLSGREPRVFWAVLHINEISKSCGMTFSECLRLTDNEMKVDKIERGHGLFIVKLPSAIILSGDRFILRDTPEKLKYYEEKLGATLKADFPNLLNESLNAAKPESEFLAEIVVTRSSEFNGSILDQAEFIKRTGLLPLAVHRPSQTPSEDIEIMQNIQNLRLIPGDVLLIQGTEESLNRFKKSGLALVLDGNIDIAVSHRAPRAVFIMIFTILLAALNLMPISYAAILGVGLMLSTHVLTWQHIAQSLDRQVILIIVASLALGLGLNSTNATSIISESFLSITSGLPIPLILTGFILLITILTNLVSNNTAGVIGAPIAIQIALDLGVDPEPFVLAVLFGANMSFLTPFGYQTNLLILSAGGYKFSDFFRVGLPLTIIMLIGLSLSLNIMYKL